MKKKKADSDQEYTGLRTTPEIKNMLRELAKHYHRSIGGEVSYLIVKEYTAWKSPEKLKDKEN